MRKVGLRGLLARRMRLALTALAVALGVTLISGTYVFTDTINGAFDRIFTESYADTDAVISPAEPDGFDVDDDQGVPLLTDDTLEAVRATPGIAEAQGNVFTPGATILGKDGEPVGLGGAPRFIASAPESDRFGLLEVADGRLPRSPDEVALIKATVEQEGFGLGDPIGIQAETPRRDYRLVGVLQISGVDSLGGATVAMFALPEAQRLAGQVGEYDQIDAAAESGVEPAELKRRLQEALGPEVTVRTGTEEAASQSQDIRDNTEFLRTALLAFAGIALFVGAFIIFNTFSITVAQRTREFALLRTLGAKRRQVMNAVLTEGLVIGVLGAAAGLGLGILLSQGLKALFDAVGVSLPSSGTVIATRTIVVSLLVGTLVTVVSSVVPAIRATRVPPVTALREGAVLPPGRGARFVTPLAVLLCVGAVALLCVGLFADLDSGPALSFVGGGAGAAFLGVALLSPRLVGPLAAFVGRPLERAFGITGRLARENAIRQPGRTAATAAALMVGVTMFAFASIFADSARSTLREAVDQGLRAEIVIQSEDGFTPFSSGVGRAVAAVDGVRDVTSVRFTTGQIDGDGHSVIGIDPASFGRLYDAGDGREAIDDLGPGATVISKDLAEEEGLAVGDTVRLGTAQNRTVELEVTGIVDDQGLLQGDFTVANEVMQRDFGARKDGLVFAAAEDPGRAKEIQAAAERALKDQFPQVEALSKDEFSDDFAGRINDLLALIYALLALTVIVALFGIVNTLVLSITERTRELGMLRAVGTSRRQVRGMIRQEAVIMSLIGGILGIVLGTGLALLVSRAIDDLTLTIPVVTVLALLVLAAVAGILASVLPARRAARLDVLKALAYE